MQDSDLVNWILLVTNHTNLVQSGTGLIKKCMYLVQSGTGLIKKCMSTVNLLSKNNSKSNFQKYVSETGANSYHKLMSNFIKFARTTPKLFAIKTIKNLIKRVFRMI